MSDTLPPLCAYCIAARLPCCDRNGACCHAEQLRAYAAAAVAAERERIAAMLDAEHERRKHADNHAAFYARMIREQATP